MTDPGSQNKAQAKAQDNAGLPHRFLTVDDVANLLQVSPWLVREIIKRGELKVHRVGKNRIRISPETYDTYIRSIADLPPEDSQGEEPGTTTQNGSPKRGRW